MAPRKKKGGEEPPEILPEILPSIDYEKHARENFRPTGQVARFPLERFMKFVDVLRVQTKDYGLVPLKLLGSQKYVLHRIIEGVNAGITTFIILKARQLGISTLFLALDLFWAFEYPGILGSFITHDEGARDQFRNQIDVFLTTLPEGYKIDCETNNRLMLVLKNSSLFRYLVAGTRGSTNKLGRSGGSNYAHMTEVAFYGSAEDIKAVMQTFSELYPHRLYIAESTANGFNHYFDICETAKESPAQEFIFVGWWLDERNEFHQTHPLYLKYMPQGKHTPLTQLEKERIKKVKELYGVEINAGQIAWYRFHLQTKCDGDQHTMDQEMPWTDEDAFVSTGNTFFTNAALTVQMRESKQYKCKPYLVRVTDNFQDTRVIPCNIEKADLKIWEFPHAGGRYIIGGDPAYGSSPDRANGVISIWRGFSDCCVQVAELATPTISTFQYAWMLAYLAGVYGDTTVQLEITGPGDTVYRELGQLRQKLAQIVPNEENIFGNCLKFMKDFLYRRSDSLSGNVLKQWKSSQDLRAALLHKFHDGVTLKRAHCRSQWMLDECKHMEIDPESGYIGPSGRTNDDRVFGGALAYWCWDENVRPYMAAQKLTRAAVLERENGLGPDPVNKLVESFLKHAKITV